MSLPAPLTDPALAALPGVRHGFFTREGGISTGVYAGLNVGIGSGDDPAAVAENRRRAASAFGQPPERLLTAYQVHSAIAHVVDGPWPGERPQGDALVTTTPGLVLGALAADCAPVLLVDAESRVVAAAHAGWRGAFTGVVEAAVAKMVEQGARPERIVAAVGPCIGPKSYEVGPEFVDRFTEVGAERFFRPGQGDRALFDLPAYVLHRLAQAGVEQARWLGRDTVTEPDLFHSNRRAHLRDEADYGRLLSAIMLS